MIRAAWKGHFETVKYLVESACVSVDAQNQVGNTALIIAAEKGDLPIIQFLIEEAGALTDLENDVSDAFEIIYPFPLISIICRKGTLYCRKLHQWVILRLCST